MQSLLFPEFSPDDLDQRALSVWTDQWLEQFPKLSPGDDTLAASALVLRKLDTPLGPMLAAATDKLCLLEFVDEERIKKQLQRAARHDDLPMVYDERGACALLDEVQDQVEGYFAGERHQFDVPLAPASTAFQELLFRELVKIPYGTQVSYGEMASRIDRPSAARAVGAANGLNPIAIIQPCHRVVGADGTLTGYAGGLWRKQRLIELEAQDRLVP